MVLIHSLLLQAIEGESGAECKYKAYADKALQEGYYGIASLFAALSKAEAIHIANHFRALEKNGFTSKLPNFDLSFQAGTTRSNLETAIKAEYEEYRNMYPSFHKQIQKKCGGHFEAKIALLSIKWAKESEANHHALLKEALKTINDEEDVTGGNYYLCSVCGNIHYEEQFPTELCSVCGHDISFYTMIRIENDSL